MIFSSTVKLPANPLPAFEDAIRAHALALRPGVERVIKLQRETNPHTKLKVGERINELRKAAGRTDESPESLSEKIANIERTAREALPLLAVRQKHTFFSEVAPVCQTILEVAEKILPEIREKAAQVDKELARAYSLTGCTLVLERANRLADDLAHFRIEVENAKERATRNDTDVHSLLRTSLLRPLAKAMGRTTPETPSEPSVPVAPANPPQPPQVAAEADSNERAV